MNNSTPDLVPCASWTSRIYAEQMQLTNPTRRCLGELSHRWCLTEAAQVTKTEGRRFSTPPCCFPSVLVDFVVSVMQLRNQLMDAVGCDPGQRYAYTTSFNFPSCQRTSMAHRQSGITMFKYTKWRTSVLRPLFPTRIPNVSFEEGFCCILVPTNEGSFYHQASPIRVHGRCTW